MKAEKTVFSLAEVRLLVERGKKNTEIDDFSTNPFEIKSRQIGIFFMRSAICINQIRS